jgi:hypothetical protein
MLHNKTATKDGIGKVVELTANEIAQREKDEAEVAADEAANGYARRRRWAYPSIKDQLDSLYHAGVFPEDMAAKLAAVKAAHPKPE